MSKANIVIEVRGGTIVAILSTQDIIITILDYDNDKLDNTDYNPDSIVSLRELTTYIDNQKKEHNDKV